MKKNTLVVIALIFLSQFYLGACSSSTDKPSKMATILSKDSMGTINEDLGKILFFSKNATQLKKDSVIDKLKSLNAVFLDSRNNSNLILVQFGTNVPELTLDPGIGTMTANVKSRGYDIDSLSVDPCAAVCSVCLPDNGYDIQVGMIDEVSLSNFNRFHSVEGLGLNRKSEKAEFTSEVMFRDRKGKDQACSNKCCCCPNQTVRTILYSKSVRNNKLDLFDYLDAIYWAKNRKINVLINQFSFAQTTDVKVLLTKVLADVKSSNLKILSIDDSQIKDINGLIKASQDLIFSDKLNQTSTVKKTFKK